MSLRETNGERHSESSLGPFQFGSCTDTSRERTRELRRVTFEERKGGSRWRARNEDELVQRKGAAAAAYTHFTCGRNQQVADGRPRRWLLRAAGSGCECETL